MSSARRSFIDRLRSVVRRPRPRFLIVRHATYQHDFYNVVLDWVSEHYPDLFPLFDVRDLPCDPADWSGCVLHVPWLQDPVQQWCMDTYLHANDLAAQSDTRGIPVINRVDRLINATKSRGAELMRAAGAQTARTAAIRDAGEFRETLLGLKTPLMVREDWGHWPPICRADTPDEARQIALDQFKRPVAIEIVDVRDPRDGLYRKYRYVAAGDIGVSHHLQSSADWCTKGDNRVITDATRDEELAYIGRPDPNHVLFQRVRRALGFDLVAFDYGYDQDGKMVIWEANPFPYIKFSTQSLKYRNAALHRTLHAILAMYLRAASLPMPARLRDALAY